MYEMTARRRLLALLFSFTFLAGLAISASSAEAYTKHGAKWPRANISWTSSLTDARGYSYRAAASNAAHNWSSASDVNLVFLNQSPFVISKKAEGNNGFDGRAVWSYNSNKIMTKAEAYLNTSQTNAFGNNEKKLRAIYSHEIGHVLGLGHAASNAAIMYTCPACVYNTHGYYTPRADDIAGVNSIY